MALVCVKCKSVDSDFNRLSLVAEHRQSLKVFNQLDFDRQSVAVVLKKSDLSADLIPSMDECLLVASDQVFIPVQIDDLNGDGDWDELAFQLNLKAGEHKRIEILKIGKKHCKHIVFPSGVYAQMGMKNGKKPFLKMDSIYSESGDLYKPIMHHGPATESDLMAYRMYFDDRCSIDIYGKMHLRLELETTNWYSNDSLIAKQYGGDILFVKNTLGVGSPRIWNGKGTQLLKATKGRYSVVRAKGPVRTIIDMVAPNIESDTGNTKVLLRMIQYAGKRDMTLQVFAEGDLPQFCTGVRKMNVSEVNKDEKCGLLGLWGTEFPRLDHGKYPEVTVGLGVVVPQVYFDGFDQDESNHLIKLKGNNAFVEYVVTAALQDEKEGFKSAKSFFDYMDRLSLELNSPLKLSVL